MGVARKDAVVARGSCVGTGLITLMTDVAVKDAGPASGTYRVTQVEHVYTPSGFHTHFTCGPVRPRGMVDLLGSPAAIGNPLHGVLPAVVTDISDDDGLGRAKVMFTTIAKPVSRPGRGSSRWGPASPAAWSSSRRSAMKCWWPSSRATYDAR